MHFIKYLRHGQEDNSTASSEDDPSLYGDFSLKDYKLQGLSYYIVPATIVSYVTYFGAGGFLHWYYYVRQRDRPEEWKCQPTKWLSPELERHEILLGSLSLLFGSILSGIMSCYIMNGGDTYIYYNYADYGYLWAVLQWPAIFIWQVLNISNSLLSKGVKPTICIAGLFDLLGSQGFPLAFPLQTLSQVAPHLQTTDGLLRDGNPPGRISIFPVHPHLAHVPRPHPLE